jgi:hypothetical protein
MHCEGLGRQPAEDAGIAYDDSLNPLSARGLVEKLLEELDIGKLGHRRFLPRIDQIAMAMISISIIMSHAAEGIEVGLCPFAEIGLARRSQCLCATLIGQFQRPFRQEYAAASRHPSLRMLSLDR